MVDGIEPTAVLLGMPGFRVTPAAESDGEVWLAVETTVTVTGCPECGVVARSKGRRSVEVRDVPVGDRPVRLRWSKRRWSCPDSDCPRRSWTETHEAIRPRAVLTERARRWAFGQVGQRGRTVASVAAELGVGWHTVMDTIIDLGEPLIGQLTLEDVSALGMDEHRWTHRPEGWAIGFCDLDTGRLIDVIEGRSGAGIARYLNTQPVEARTGVSTVSVDPWRGYLAPVRKLLPRDHFHLIRLANATATARRPEANAPTRGKKAPKNTNRASGKASGTPTRRSPIPIRDASTSPTIAIPRM